MATLIEATRRVCSDFGKSEYWFRGHTDASWQLVPSVHRDYDNVAKRILLGRFRLAAPSRHAHCPELIDIAAWMCLAQHYGLPTRLLDWTSLLIAAAYFAVSYVPSPGPAAVWMLVPSELNRASSFGTDGLFMLHGPDVKPLLAAAVDGGPPNDSVLAALAPYQDLRIMVQQGAFTIHGDSTPLEHAKGAERFLAKFVIPEDARPTLDDELWVLGTRRSALFPDLANLALELRNDQRLAPKNRPPASTVA